MKPEEQTEIELWDWFKTYSNNIVEIYFNRVNQLGCKVFKVKGESKEKPDFVIAFDIGYGLKYIAIEIKTGLIYKDVCDSSKIFSVYYQNYISGKTEYFIDDSKIEINHFCIATSFSKYGKLFKDYDNKVNDNAKPNENEVWRMLAFNNHIIPRYEFQRTKDFLRRLWSDFRMFRKKNIMKIKPSLGIIVSDNLIKFTQEELEGQFGMIGKPLIISMIYKDYKNKPQWQGGYFIL